MIWKVQTKDVFAMPLLYKATFALSLIGLALCLIGIATLNRYSEIFAWLFLYVPCLWALWISCVFVARGKMALRKLIILWLIIDITVLALFVSFAINVENWANSRGIDMAVLVSNFPVLIPTGLVYALIPDSAQRSISLFFDFLVRMFGGGVGDAFAVWLCVSLVAALQCAALIRLTWVFTSTKKTSDV